MQYLGVLRRRKWVILPPLLLIPAIAFLLSQQQPSEYRATSQVLLNRQDVVTAILSQQPNSAYLDPERLLATQSDVARSPALIQDVVRAANVDGLTEAYVSAHSEISPHANADVLEFAVTDRDPQVAARIASVYAEKYTSFRREIDTKAARDALQKVEAEIEALEAQGVSSGSPRYTELVDLRTRFATAATLLTGNTMVIRPAEGADKISPRPTRNALLGGLVAIVVALGFAFLAEALDSRIRNVQEIEGRLAMPQLGSLPPPPVRLRRADELVMLAEPSSPAAEAIRHLRTNLEFVLVRTGARAILVTSGLEREGKSTTVANLAVAFARTGRRVVLADLDLRRPYLHRFFKTPPSPGVVEVALGQAGLDEALTPILVSQLTDGASRHAVELHRSSALVDPASETANGDPGSLGVLELLPVGQVVRDAGEFVADQPLGEVLASLRQRADLVLIDTPPMLTVGDATTLSARVDGILVVSRLPIRQGALINLGRQLDKCPVAKLGFVAAGVAAGDEYGLWYGERHAPSEAAPTRRALT
jgi:Mrp family chromosome partitioning ATPase/capsular polysaccharide biosynthesis protein